MRSGHQGRNLLILCFLFPFVFHVPLLSQVPSSILAWEKDIRDLELRDSLETDPPGAILFAGSSSIRLWDSIQSDMAPWPVIRRGYGGAKMSDFTYYEKRILYPHKPRAIVLFIANDITGSPGDLTPAQAAEAFSKILAIIRGKFPDTPVFWIQVTPTPSRWASWETVKEAQRLIGEVCSRDKACTLIPTERIFLGPDGMPRREFFREDMLHLNRDGYRAWATAIKVSLQDKLK
jgi:hypothetical protein